MKTLNIQANFDKNSDMVIASLLIDDDGVLTNGNLTSGTVRLLYSNISDVQTTEVEVAEPIQLTQNLRGSDGVILLNFLHPKYTHNLSLDATVIVDATTLTKKVNVLIEDDVPVRLPSNRIPQLVEFPSDYPLELKPVLNEQIQPVITDIAATSIGSQQEVVYSGGGNRFLFGYDNELILQPLNSLPAELSARTFIECGGSNLQTNPTFSGATSDTDTPPGYEVNAPSNLVTTLLVNDLSDYAKTWQVRFRTSEEVTAFNSVYIQPTSAVSINVAEAHTFSVYGYLKYPTVNSKISTIRVILYFISSSDVQLGNKQQSFDADDYNEMMGLWAITCFPSDYPVGTVKLMWQLEFGSVDPGDDVTVSLFMPQIENKFVATSRMVGARTADVYYTPAQDMANGSISVTVVPGYSDFPFEQVTVFDAGGYKLSHRTDGFLEYTIGSNSINSTTPYNMVSGKETTFVTSWGTNKWRISVDGSILKDSTAVIPTPTLSDIFVCSTSLGVEQMNAELVSVKLMRDFI